MRKFQHQLQQPSPFPQPTPGKQSTTTWADDNGNPLKPTEPGSKEPGTVSGYEYVKTVTDPNGNIKHIFKKINNCVAPALISPSRGLKDAPLLFLFVRMYQLLLHYLN